MSRPIHRHCAIVLALLTTTSCEFSLDVAAAWQISYPRVLGVRMEVVEPAPIWLERLGFDPDDAPIAEALPGDRVRLVPLVVDAEGRQQPPEAIDALWFQCGEYSDRSECTVAVPRCDLVKWTTEIPCEIGRGLLEFPFPAVGPASLESGSMRVLGIIGREPEVDAERCRAGLLAGTDELSGCSVVVADVSVGPRWALYIDAIEAGAELDVNPYEIPYAALQQRANRTPAPEPAVLLDADTGIPLEGSPPRVHPGQRVKTSGPSWRTYDRQAYMTGEPAQGVSEFYFFEIHLEQFGVRYFASGPIMFTKIDGPRLEFVVDEYAHAGIARLIVAVVDRRKYDAGQSTVGISVQEIEVVP